MRYLIEDFSPGKHRARLQKLLLSPESSAEIRRVKPEFMTDEQFVYLCLETSEESRVFIHRATGRICGAFGYTFGVFKGHISVCPWFLSDGFERKDPMFFLKVSKAIVNKWLREIPTKHWGNVCLADPRIIKWLRYLGFTVDAHRCFMEAGSAFCEFYLEAEE